jgi:hypothetical protein
MGERLFLTWCVGWLMLIKNSYPETPLPWVRIFRKALCSGAHRPELIS